MKTLLTLAAASAVIVIAAPAFAETDGSIGYSNFDIGSSNLGALTGRLGWTADTPASGQSVMSFGVEGEASVGLSDDTSGTGAGRVSNKLSSEYGVFGTVTAASDSFSANARIGYANIDAKTTSGTGTTAIRTSYNEGGLAYGAGAAVNFGDNAVRADYTHYDVNLGHMPAVGPTPAVKGEDANVWTLSFLHRFQ
jgi:hypothetical protein